MALGTLLTITGAFVARPPAARAVVVHQQGYAATVLGWTSWYGSYALAGVGQVWCIDHGLRAPDAALGYAPAPPPALPLTSRTSMAWVVSRYGPTAGRLDAAAIMLVLHDLAGATYPAGPLHVDALQPSQVAGFDGQEVALLHRARALRADATAHGAWVGPWQLSLTLPPRLAPGRSAPAVARLTDGGGHPLAGAVVSFAADTPSPTPRQAVTDASGRATTTVVGRSSVLRLRATATVPDLALHVQGPSGAPAQRVAVPASATVQAVAELQPTPATVRILKTSSTSPATGVAGAHFTLRRQRSGAPGTVVAELVTGPAGTSQAVRVVPGTYLVEETVPPPGYRPAGPWTVHLLAGTDRTIRVADPPAPVGLGLLKVDASTGQPLAGATLQLQADRDGNGSFEWVDTPFTSTHSVLTRTDLAPGLYRVVELAPPAGYLRFDPVVVTLLAGRSVVLRLADRPTPPSTTTSTTTTVPATTTTAPTTTTTPAPTTTAVPPSTTSSSTTTTTTAPPSTTSSSTSTVAAAPTGPLPPTAASPPEITDLPPELPRTGSSTMGLGLLSAGILCLGESLVLTSRRRP